MSTSAGFELSLVHRLGVSADSRSSRRPVLETAVLALVLFVLFLFLDLPLAIAVPATILLALTGQHFVSLSLGSDRDCFGPVTFISAYFAIDFGLRSLYVALSPAAGRVGRVGYDDYLPLALWCATLAYASFLAGVHSRFIERFTHERVNLQFRWPARVPAFQLLGLSLCGFCAMAYLFKTGAAVVGGAATSVPVSGFVVALQRTLHLSWIATCVCLFTRSRIRNKALLWPLILLSLAFLALGVGMTGGKEALIGSVLETVIAFHYLKKRLRPWQVFAFLAPVAIIGFGMLNFYRFVVVGQEGSPASFSDLGSRASSALQSAGSGGRASAIEQLLSRQAGVDALALTLKFTPSPQPFLYGLPVVGGVISGLIPRQLWPGKPAYDPSRDFEQNYMGMPAYYEGHSSVHIVSELYQNFWFLGVVGGMFTLGMACRAFYIVCAPGWNNPVGVYFYAFLMPLIAHLFENALGAFLTQVPRAFILAICAALFLGVRRAYSHLRAQIANPPWFTSVLTASPRRPIF